MFEGVSFVSAGASIEASSSIVGLPVRKDLGAIIMPENFSILENPFIGQVFLE